MENKKKTVKKEAKKIAKNALEVASQERKPMAIETTFSLGGATPLALKVEGGGLYWILKLNIDQILSRSYYKYNLRLSINEEPFNRRINDAENKISEINTEAHLPGMENKQEIKELQDRIKTIKNELNQLIKQTDVMEFMADVLTLKYSGVATVIEFKIPADTINLLNKNRFFFSQYKIELEPIWETPANNQ